MKFKLYFILHIFILLCLFVFLVVIQSDVAILASFIMSSIIGSLSFFMTLKYVKRFIGFWCAFSLFFAITPFIGIIANSLFFYIVYSESKVIKEIERTPKLLEVKISKWKDYFSTPAQYASYLIRHSQGNSYLIYLLYLIDLYNQKIIYFSLDYQFIYYPVRFEYNDYKNSILSVLEDCRKTVQKNGQYVEIENNYWKLRYSCLYDYFSLSGTPEKLDMVRDGLRNTTIPLDMFKDFKKDIDFIYTALLHKDKNEEYVISFAEILRDYFNLEKLFLFALQFQFRNRSRRKIRNIEEDNSDVYIDLAIRSYPLKYSDD